MSGILITEGAVPDLPAHGQTLLAAADTLSSGSARVVEHIDAAAGDWATLPTPFDTPDTSTLVAAFSPVVTAATDLHDTADTAGRALSELGDILVTLEQARGRLLDDIRDHRATVLTYRADNPTDDEEDDPFAGWGPNGETINTDLWQQCTALQRSFDDALDICAAALRRIPDGYGFSQVTAAGAGTLTAPVSLESTADRFRTGVGMAVLDLLSQDPDRIAALLELHPEWADLLRDNPPDATEVAAWWAGLSGPAGGDGWSSVQAALINAAPGVVGALGGAPSAARRDANRLVAEARRDELQQLIDDRGWTYQPGTYERVRMPIPADWQSELDYLDRVAAGDVDLYLYDRDRGQIIEMYGDPEHADVIMSFMPGTNTTMQSFYTSTSTTGVSAFTRWEVLRPARGTEVAGFVVKQGAFPQLTIDILATGPQNNDLMEALGASYADFNREIQAISPGTPQVSVEHSAGSAAGGEAEMAGAIFAARIPLAGIGMTESWEAQPGVDYYAMQAPNDINRNFDDTQVWNWGYATPANTASGFTELDSGIPGTSPWIYVATPLSPPLAAAAELNDQVEHHNQIMSGDVSVNGAALQQMQRILALQAAGS